MQSALCSDVFTYYFENILQGIDVIILCGSYVSYDYTDIEIIKSNCIGINNIVKLAIDYRCKKMKEN